MGSEQNLWSIHQFIDAYDRRPVKDYSLWLSAVLRPGLISAYLDWEQLLLEHENPQVSQAALELRSNPAVESILRLRAIATSLTDSSFDSNQAPWLESVLPAGDVRDQLNLLGQHHPAYNGRIVEMSRNLIPEQINNYANLWLYEILGSKKWSQTYDHTNLLLTQELNLDFDWSWFPRQIDLGVGILQKRLNFLVLQPYASTANYTSNFFDYLAKTYEQGADASLKTQVSQGLVDRLVIKSQDRILDLACGTGFNRQFLNAEQVVGVDISAGMLELASRKGEQVCQADALRLPFAKSSFDVALMTFADLWVVDLGKVLSESGRVLRPGGRLGFNIHRPIHGFGAWQEQYSNLLESIGFANLTYDTQTINTDKTGTYQAYFVTGTKQ